MKIIYRISDSGYNKVKPNYINNEKCLRNAVKVFNNVDWTIIADNCSLGTLTMIEDIIDCNISIVSIGHGAGTFNMALDKALKQKDDEIIYL
jgi:hypothetical protein